MAQEPSQIRDEIAETRAELGETVHALAQKADVRARLRETVSDNTAQLQGLQTASSKPWLLPVAIAFVTGLTLGRRMARSG